MLWAQTDAADVIAKGGPAGPWDVVVLQEDLPETDLATFNEYAGRFHAQVASAPGPPACVLMSCWAYPRLPSFTTEGIAAAHDETAARLSAGPPAVRVAHAGRAWLRAVRPGRARAREAHGREARTDRVRNATIWWCTARGGA